MREVDYPGVIFLKWLQPQAALDWLSVAVLVTWQHLKGLVVDQLARLPRRSASVRPIHSLAMQLETGRKCCRGATIAIEEINQRGGVLGMQIEHIPVDVEDMSPEKIIHRV